MKSRRAQLWLILLAQGREQRPSRASHCTSVNARSGPRLISLLAMPITAGATSCNRKESHFLCSHSTGSRDFFRTTSRNNNCVQSIQTGQPLHHLHATSKEMKLLRQLFRDTERTGRMLSLLKSRRAHRWLILLAQVREQRPSRVSHCTSVHARSGPWLISLLAMPITAGATSCNRKETHFLCSHSTGSRDFFRTTSRNNNCVQSIQTGQPLQYAQCHIQAGRGCVTTHGATKHGLLNHVGGQNVSRTWQEIRTREKQILEPAAVPCHFALIFREQKLHQGIRRRVGRGQRKSRSVSLHNLAWTRLCYYTRCD